MPVLAVLVACAERSADGDDGRRSRPTEPPAGFEPVNGEPPIPQPCPMEGIEDIFYAFGGMEFVDDQVVIQLVHPTYFTENREFGLRPWVGICVDVERHIVRVHGWFDVSGTLDDVKTQSISFDVYAAGFQSGDEVTFELDSTVQDEVVVIVP